MKFLVIGEDVDYNGPMNPKDLIGRLEMVYIPSFEMLENWEKEKKVVGGFFAAQRAGAVIIEAPTAEELSRTMTSLPFWGNLKRKVIPLQSFRSGIEDAKRTISSLKAAASVQH